MRKIFSTLSFLIIIQSSFAQIGLSVFNYRPTGHFGFWMKPTNSLELAYMPSFEEGRHVRFVGSVTYLVMKARMDTIPTFDNKKDPASFKRFNISQAFAGFDIAFFKHNQWVVYGGVDASLGIASVAYYNLEDQPYVEGAGYLIGYRGRLGVEYNFNKAIGVFARVQRAGWVISSPVSLNAANDYGIGVKYNFDN